MTSQYMNVFHNVVSPEAKMSSKDIAEMVNKRHDNVKRTIETLIEQGVITRPQIEDESYKDGSGRVVNTKLYVFSGEQGKRDSIVVVAQLSPKFTAALVDRWQELEQVVRSNVLMPSPQQQAIELAPAAMRAAEAFGFKGNQAVLSSNRAIQCFTGVDLLEAFGAKTLPAPDNEPLLTPSDIGAKLDLTARVVNTTLIAAGLQTQERDHKDRPYYELTKLGEQYGVFLDVGKTNSFGTPVRQLKWKSSVVDFITQFLDSTD